MINQRAMYNFLYFPIQKKRATRFTFSLIEESLNVIKSAKDDYNNQKGHYVKPK